MNELTKKNILLLERFPNEKKTEYVENKKFFGSIVYRIVQPRNKIFKEIAHYNQNENKTDLHALKDKVGWYLVEVAKDKYNNFLWIKSEITDYHEEEKQEFVEIGKPENCNEDEITLLNEVFPEYFNHAY